MPKVDQKKILIIDDEKELCSLLKDYFSEEGYLVKVAYEGRTGTEMIKSFEPDIIILDHRMPGWNGIEVLKKAREFSSVPIICISAVTDQATVDECLNLGANSYIFKPVDLDDVLQTIRSNLKA